MMDLYDEAVAEADMERYPHAREVGTRIGYAVAIAVLADLPVDAVIAAVFATLRVLRQEGKYRGDSDVELSTIMSTCWDGGQDDA